jgi:hypothetical protein
LGCGHRFRPRCLLDQLRRTIEVLRVERRLNLGGAEFVAHAGDALVESGQAAVVGADAAGGFERLQSHVEFAVVERRLHPRDENAGKTL